MPRPAVWRSVTGPVSSDAPSGSSLSSLSLSESAAVARPPSPEPSAGTPTDPRPHSPPASGGSERTPASPGFSGRSCPAPEAVPSAPAKTSSLCLKREAISADGVAIKCRSRVTFLRSITPKPIQIFYYQIMHLFMGGIAPVGGAITEQKLPPTTLKYIK